MKYFAYALVIIGTFIGGLTFLESMVSANGAPQQAAGAAMALCWCVIPYIFARAVEKLSQKSFYDALEGYFGKKSSEPQMPVNPVHYPGLTAPARKPGQPTP